jgi:2,4'-dihydroxyacetophenone dioxygenase
VVELMRLRPGVRLGLHRHTGEVHTLDLAGDWWEATGSEELLVYAVVKGSVEYLGAHHSVLQRITTPHGRLPPALPIHGCAAPRIDLMSI